MKKDRFPDIKIEIKAEGLAKKILGKPAASTPSVYGEEQPEGKNLPNVSIKGKNQELQSLLETSNKKPVYTGLVKEAIQELRKDLPNRFDEAMPGTPGSTPTVDRRMASYKGKGGSNLGYEFQSDDELDEPLTSNISGYNFGAGGDESAPIDPKSPVTGGFGSFTPAGASSSEVMGDRPDFDMAAGAKRGSLDVNVDPTPSPEDAGTSGPAPTKYVGNLQIPNNIASQGQDAIDEFVKRSTTAGSGDGLENNMEKAPAPAGNPMRDVAAQAVAHFVAPTSPKPVTKMNTQELVKEAVFEIRKDNGADYKFADLLLDGVMAAGYTKVLPKVLSNLDKVGAGVNYLIDAADPEIMAAKKPKTDKPNWLMDKITREVDIVRTNQPAGQQAVTFKDKKRVADAKGAAQAVVAGGKNVKDFTKKMFGVVGGFNPKGLNPFKLGKKSKLGILATVIYGGLNYTDDLVKKVGVDKKTVDNVQQGVLGFLDFMNPLRDSGGFSRTTTNPSFIKSANKVLEAVYTDDSAAAKVKATPTPVGVPPGVNMKNIQKAPMVGGAAGQMPKATTMNRPANMGVNIQQPVVSGAGTMKNIEKRVAANKPKAVGAPKKTRATKRKGR